MTRESLAAIANEIAEKERRVRAFMTEKGYDAVVLTTQANFAWFTCGGDSHVGYGTDMGCVSVVVTQDAKYLICENIEAPRMLDEELAGQGFEFRVRDWWAGGLSDEVGKLASGRIAADTPIDGTDLAAGQIPPMRYSLTEQEIERYRWLGRQTGECLSWAAHAVEPAMTEHQVAGLLGGEMIMRGITAHLILVAADERIAKYRHPIPTDKRVGKCVMLVAGAKRWGLIVSATRLVHFGPLSAELRRKHDAVMAVDAEFITHTRPGMSVADVFSKGVAAYEREGFADEWRLHHQGGSAGYAARDYRARTGISEVVQANQAFAWNPSITGTKCEDTVIALKDRTEIISAHGDWPMREIKVGSSVVQREDILEL